MKLKVLIVTFFCFSLTHLQSCKAKETIDSLAEIPNPSVVEYKSISVDGLDIFYREAGDVSKPTILLFHGFPSSSHMYRDLINDLADNYHVIAPDYPGFGQSSAPTTEAYTYTFENLSMTMEHFINTLQIKKVTLYLQDYGGPIGMRIATRRPELIQSLIIQNANAYVEGLGEILKPLTDYIQDPNPKTEQSARFFLTLEATKWQYLTGAENPKRIAPDSYSNDQYYLDRLGNDDIQLALFRDYGTNIALYDDWHTYFATYQPHLLVIWGENDQFFISDGALAYKKDNPNAEIHLVNGGHFALEEHHMDISKMIIKFMTKFVQ